MYEVVDIIENDMTRFVILKNLITNTVDKCFDDSAVVSDSNFNFMQVGEKYDCKIKLFGNPSIKKTDSSVSCKVIKRNITVGNTKMTKVEINGNKYFILNTKLENFLNYCNFEFVFSRKDLVAVNNMVHTDLL